MVFGITLMVVTVAVFLPKIADYGAVWKTIVEIADRHDAAAIVMGSRGLTRWGSMLLGSVSSAVVHHADRPTLVIRQPVGAA